MKEVEVDDRAPLREFQPDVKGKGKARVVEQPAASVSDSDEDPEEGYGDGPFTQDSPAEEVDEDHDDSPRASTPPPAVRPRAPVAKFLDRGPPPGARKKAAEEPMVVGVSTERSAQRVDEMEVLREDAR